MLLSEKKTNSLCSVLSTERFETPPESTSTCVLAFIPGTSFVAWSACGSGSTTCGHMMWPWPTTWRQAACQGRTYFCIWTKTKLFIAVCKSPQSLCGWKTGRISLCGCQFKPVKQTGSTALGIGKTDLLSEWFKSLYSNLPECSSMWRKYWSRSEQYQNINMLRSTRENFSQGGCTKGF